MKDFIFKTTINWVNIDLSYFDNQLDKPILLFIHWLWCSKNDFINSFEYMKNHRLISLDFPWCWNSSFDETLTLTTNNLVELINEFVKFLKIKDFIIVWHSYWWLISTKYVSKYWAKWIINVEWLWEPWAKFSARKTLKNDFAKYISDIFPNTILWLKNLNNTWATKYAETLENFTNKKAFYDYSVSFSKSVDENNLIEEFNNLKIPKLFIYGKNSTWFTFLDILGENEKVFIENSFHFPNYDNPWDFYKVIEKFSNYD